MNARPSPMALLILVAGLTGAANAQSAAPAAPPAQTPSMQPAKAPTPVVRNTNQWDLPSKGEKLAISGYDPVSYFPEGGGKPQKGKKELTHVHEGVTYRFVSAKNRDLFHANAAKYEPAHGGWCSWAMLDGEKTEPDPETFILKDNRLFLFYNGFAGNTKKSWEKGNHAEEVRKADAAWKRLSGEEPRLGMAFTLQKTLDDKKAEFAAKMPAAQMAMYQKGIDDVAASGVLATALKVGAPAPDFTLPGADGKSVTLSEMLKTGPVVLTWYRGEWCPYCNIQLQAYQAAMPELTAAGATLVAISPQTPARTSSTKMKSNLTFPVVSDAGNAVAKQYGIAYTLPSELGEKMKPMLAEANGDDGTQLPLAATYVIGTDGMVAWSSVSADYTTRAEPADIIAAVQRAKAAK